MCMQCMAGASMAVGGAAGTRAWLATRTWVTPRHLKRATIALVGGAILASSTLPGPAPTSALSRPTEAASPAPQR